RMPRGQTATQQLKQVSQFIEDTRGAELSSVSKELAKLDVDWEVPAGTVAGPKPSELAVTVKTDRPNDTVKADESINIEVTVQNNGTVPVYRLRATTESDDPYF